LRSPTILLLGVRLSIIGELDAYLSEPGRGRRFLLLTHGRIERALSAD